MSLGRHDKYISTDILIIGGGMGGCSAAIKAKAQGLDVTITDKACVGRSGATHYSEGDFVNFNPALGHKLDAWLKSAAVNCEYINNPEWTSIVLKESQDRLKDLVAWGVKLVEENGKPKVDTYVIGDSKIAKDAGVVFYSMLNRKYAPVLRRKVLEDGIRVIDRVMVYELLKQDGQIVGAVGMHTINGDIYVFKAKAVIIASGSSNLKTANRPIHYWTSDGDAMAYRAGAEVTGKEFWIRSNWINRADEQQLEKSPPPPLKIENVDRTLTRYPFFRGEGGGMNGGARFTVNAEGMPAISPVWEAHCGRAPIYTNLTSLTPVRREHMQCYYDRLETAEMQKTGFDPFKGGFFSEFSPGAMITMQINGGGNGIWPINTKCATALPGLYAAGNSCATRASGGAGYAGMGWGISHAAVTGTIAGLAAAEYVAKAKETKIDEAELTRAKEYICAPVERKGGFSPAWLVQIIQSITIPYFYLWVKKGDRLQAALTIAEFVNSHLVPMVKAGDAHEWRMALETRNMALNAEMMLRASLFRTESRGSHFREDYPRRDDPTWLAWVKLKNDQGKMTVSREPLPQKYWPDLSEPYEKRYPLYFPGE